MSQAIHGAKITSRHERVEPTAQFQSDRPDAFRSATPRIAFGLLLVYILIDYLRPQDLPGLGFLRFIRPSLMMMVMMAISLYNHREALPKREPKFLICVLLLAEMAAWVPFARTILGVSDDSRFRGDLSLRGGLPCDR